jgi:hypothetical protein
MFQGMCFLWSVVLLESEDIQSDDAFDVDLHLPSDDIVEQAHTLSISRSRTVIILTMPILKHDPQSDTVSALKFA